MLFFTLILLAVVQALTEFLPVSSSGHLVIIQNLELFDDIFGNIDTSTELFIDIALHIATLVAVIIYLRADIIYIVKGFFQSVAKKEFSAPPVLMARNILIACVPAGLVGVLAGEFLKSFYEALLPVFIFLIINGFILISTKKIPLKNRKIEEMGIIRSLMIGFFQAVAVLPGISRSGMTITGGLLGGLAPNDSAKFSFLMAIPVIAGAGFLETVKAASNGFPQEIILPLLIAMAVAVVIALLSLRLLFAIVKQVRINVFGYYTIVLGIVGITYLLLK